MGTSATIGSGKPVVISAKQGSSKAVDGSGTFRPVADLPLPEGRWWIIAKGVGDTGVVSTSYRCGVDAGGDGDLIGVPLGSVGEPLDTIPFVIQVVHDFGAPGRPTSCARGTRTSVSGTSSSTRSRSGRLTNEPRPAATTGSGAPRVISGWDDGPINVPVGAQLSTILTQPLPQGKWLVFAKAWFEAAGVPSDSTIRRVARQLGFSGFKDDVELRYRNNVSRVGVMVLQVPASSPGGRSAILRCRRTHGDHTGNMMWVQITAIRLKSILAWPL